MDGGLLLPNMTKSRDLLTTSNVAAIVEDLRSEK
jgi:hypothetical protein